MVIIIGIYFKTFFEIAIMLIITFLSTQICIPKFNPGVTTCILTWAARSTHFDVDLRIMHSGPPLLS